MSANNSQNAQKDMELRRREMVGRLRARQLTLREIVVELAKDEEFRNQRTGKPFSLCTVHGDIAWCKEQWREHAIKSIDEHKARILNELEALKRKGWDEKDYTIVMKAIEKECQILGINAPTKVDATGMQPMTYVQLMLMAEGQSLIAGAIDGHGLKFVDNKLLTAHSGGNGGGEVPMDAKDSG